MAAVREGWSAEEMETRRPPCFPFFLGECEHTEVSCNYNHNPIFKANLGNIPGTASKEHVSEELAQFRPVHVAFTGNPAHLNFGKGQGLVAFSREEDLVAAVVTTAKGAGIKVTLTDHVCRGCGVLMRFSPGGTPLFKSTNVTGTKKEPMPIAKPAAGPFVCGECSAEQPGKSKPKGSKAAPKKQVASSTQPRALKQGEAVW